MTKSYIAKYTDQQLIALEQKLNSLYRTAYADARKDADRYWKGYDEVVGGKKIHHAGFLERYNIELQAKEDGAYTDAQWNAWINSQMARGGRLDGVAGDIADRMAKTNEIAAEYINGTTPSVYKESANYEAFTIEKDYKLASSFRLVQETSQGQLARGENHVEFRTVSTNPQRDYNWNFDRITASLQIGMLKGEGYQKIAQRFLQTMGTNEVAARRNARTAITSAYNSGRMDTFEEASDMGIEILKEWKSTFDIRTRESHVQMDGERVPYDEPFSNGLMYPGDPSGDPAEVYNCRCSMGRVRSESATRDTVAEYRKWYADHEAEYEAEYILKDEQQRSKIAFKDWRDK